MTRGRDSRAFAAMLHHVHQCSKFITLKLSGTATDHMHSSEHHKFLQQLDLHLVVKADKSTCKFACCLVLCGGYLEDNHLYGKMHCCR